MQGPESVALLVKHPPYSGVNLKAYKLAAQDTDLRAKVGYLLLMCESEVYLEYVEKELDSVPSEEIDLWRAVHSRHTGVPSGHPRTILSTGYADALFRLISRSDEPTALYYTASVYEHDGNEQEAERRYLRALQKDSIYDALAAQQLARDPAHRGVALNRLRELLASQSRTLATSAALALMEVFDAKKELEPLCEAYIESPTPENLSIWLKEVRKVDKQASADATNAQNGRERSPTDRATSKPTSSTDYDR